jgi:drug/metabolite transporter (DMT)-like permease
MSFEMLSLLLAILCGALIHVAFKLYSRYEINQLQAVVSNYLVCAIVGISISGDWTHLEIRSTWFIACFLIGALFVLVFWAMAFNTHLNGISVNALSNKLSVVIPISVAVLILGEDIHWYGVLGILFCLISIIIFSRKLNEHHAFRSWFIPGIVFFGSGLVDLSLKLLSLEFGMEASMYQMSYAIFAGAFIFGILVIMFQKSQRSRLKMRNFFAGAMLGIPNYFSIAFLLLAIDAFKYDSTFVFGSQKIGIVVVSALISYLIFKEKWTRQKVLGLLLAIIAVVLIAYERV